MMFKRVIIIMAAILMLTGMAVSTIADKDVQSVVEIGTPVICEITQPENITTQTPVAFDVDMSELQTINLDIAPTEPVTTMRMVNRKPATEKVTQEKVVAETVEETMQATVEVIEESTKSTEKQEEQNVKPIEEGTIIAPSLDVSAIVLEEYTWDGEILNSHNGTVQGPNGKETYYNLDMSCIIKVMKDLGYDYEYSVRGDGVKMFGPFIMVAADLDLRPRGSIIKTSLGWAMVCDTGGFTAWNSTQLDIATAW